MTRTMSIFTGQAVMHRPLDEVRAYARRMVQTLARPEDAAHPAQAPAQFRTRVVGRVPQQFTEV